VRVFQPHASHEPDSVWHDGEVEQAVAGGDLLRHLVRVALGRGLVQVDDAGNDVGRLQDHLGGGIDVYRLAGGEVELEQALLEEAPPEGIGGAELELRRQSGPEIGERQPGRERYREVDGRIGRVLGEVVEDPCSTERVVGERKG